MRSDLRLSLPHRVQSLPQSCELCMRRPPCARLTWLRTNLGSICESNEQGACRGGVISGGKHGAIAGLERSERALTPLVLLYRLLAGFLMPFLWFLRTCEQGKWSTGRESPLLAAAPPSLALSPAGPDSSRTWFLLVWF